MQSECVPAKAEDVGGVCGSAVVFWDASDSNVNDSVIALHREIQMMRKKESMRRIHAI